jgi:hypothetical protein
MHRRTVGSTGAEDLVPRTLMYASVSEKPLRHMKYQCTDAFFLSVGSIVGEGTFT